MALADRCSTPAGVGAACCPAGAPEGLAGPVAVLVLPAVALLVADAVGVSVGDAVGVSVGDAVGVCEVGEDVALELELELELDEELERLGVLVAVEPPRVVPR